MLLCSNTAAICEKYGLTIEQQANLTPRQLQDCILFPRTKEGGLCEVRQPNHRRPKQETSCARSKKELLATLEDIRVNGFLYGDTRIPMPAKQYQDQLQKILALPDD